jgi:hypothetical protein
MRNTSPVPSKSLLLSVLILAAAAVLAVEIRRTPQSPAAIQQSLPQAIPPQSFHEAIADADVGPGLAEPQPLPSRVPAK